MAATVKNVRQLDSGLCLRGHFADTSMDFGEIHATDNTSFTIAALVMLTATGVTIYSSGYSFADNKGFLFALGASNPTLRVVFGVNFYHATKAFGKVGEFCWVIVSFNASTNSLSFYRNSTLLGNVVTSVVPVTGKVGNKDFFGIETSSNDRPFKGYVRRMIIAQRVLTQTEIDDLVLNDTRPSNLFAHWNMNDIGGTLAVPDSSGNNRNGTYKSMDKVSKIISFGYK